MNRKELIEVMRGSITKLEAMREGEGRDDQIDEMVGLLKLRASIIETAKESDLERLMIRWCREDIAAGRTSGDQPS